MDSIKAFFEKYTATTHAIGLLITFLISAYFISADFKAYVTDVAAMLNPFVARTLSVIVGLYLLYRNGSPNTPNPSVPPTPFPPSIKPAP